MLRKTLEHIHSLLGEGRFMWVGSQQPAEEGLLNLRC